MSGSPFRLSAAVLAVLTCAACGTTAPSSPSGASGGVATGAAGVATVAGRGNGGGGGGGGGGTSSTVGVEISGHITWDAGQTMTVGRDNKKQLAASGTMTGVTIDFSEHVNEGNCTHTGPDWDDPSVKVLREALGDKGATGIAELPSLTRDVNFQIDHNGNGTGSGAIRLLSVPEGATPWVSYCFNTGLGLCSTNESPDGTFAFSGSGARAVLNGVELVCRVPDLHVGATLEITQ